MSEPRQGQGPPAQEQRDHALCTLQGGNAIAIITDETGRILVMPSA